MRDIHLPGRSTVYGAKGAAATSQPLATLAAIEMMRNGGNAVDAAIAACAVQCVVEPMGTGIGGDCFVMLWRNDLRRTFALNGSGRAPSGLSTDFLKATGVNSIGLDSVHAITIPGAVDAWCRLHGDHGRLSFGAILEPAIRYAEVGFALAPCTAVEWAASVQHLSKNSDATAQYLAHGQAPKAGDLWKQPLLAESLRHIAKEGRAGFYEGRVAEDMVTSLRRLGGTHTLADFATTAATYVAPIKLRFGDADILQMPPNSQGIIALLILKALKSVESRRRYAPQSAERFQLLAEATRLAFETKIRGISDPDYCALSIDGLLAEPLPLSFIEKVAAKDIPESGVKEIVASGERDTVYIAVIDPDRNVCSFINSLYMPFGSGIASQGFGVLFHNRGADFVAQQGYPNSVAPRKRPTHTILPALAMKDGQPWLAYGVKGAGYQPIGQAQVLSNLIDYGMDLQSAIDDPRCAYDGGKINVERGISEEIRQGLRAAGYTVAEAALPMGGAQCAAIDWRRGTISAASDPRKDGLALCY
jgi:gamma-glutamyltranspeptidase / glutathione hydrolase